MKPPKVPSVISIIILTTITLVFWVFFQVIRAFITQPTTNVPTSITDPLNPSLDKTTIDKVQNSVFFEDSQIPQTLSVASPTPTLSPTPTPNLQTPNPVSTASATTGGALR